MRQIAFKLICLLIVINLIAGCGSKPQSSTVDKFEDELPAVTNNVPAAVSGPLGPDDIVVKYFTALEEGRIADAKKYLSKESLSKTSDESLNEVSLEIKKTKKNYRVSMYSDKENSAKVTYLCNRLSDDDIEENTVQLIKEDGEWKIIPESISSASSSNAAIDNGNIESKKVEGNW